MQDPSPDPAFRLRVADLSASRPVAFELAPDARVRRDLAETLGLSEIRKLRFSGQLVPAGRSDWRLEGMLGATVVQPCVVTLAPVTTRIDEPVERMFLAEAPAVPEGEMEMPEDDSSEPLGDEIDLGTILFEALQLAVPLYPRADGAQLGDARFTEPGKTPLTDEEVKPFSGLAALRDKLGDDDG